MFRTVCAPVPGLCVNPLVSASATYLAGTYTTDSREQLNRCPSLNQHVYHSRGGGDVQCACTVGKYQQRDNKVPHTLSIAAPAHKQTHVQHTQYRCTITVQYSSEENDRSFLFAIFSPSFLQVGLLFLKVGSKVGWQIWHFSCALSNSPSLSLFVQFTTLHTWHSLHTHTHTFPRYMFPLQSLSLPFGHPAHVCENRENTHTSMNHSESCNPNSTQREVLHLTRTPTIYKGLGVHGLIIGHGGCWQWTGG